MMQHANVPWVGVALWLATGCDHSQPASAEQEQSDNTAPAQPKGPAHATVPSSPVPLGGDVAVAEPTAGPSRSASATQRAGQGGTTTGAKIAQAGMTASTAGAGARGGEAATPEAPAAGSGGPEAGAMAEAPQDSGPLTLTAVDVDDLGDGFVAFPDSARPPSNQSPGFRWSGVPAEAKSVVLVFRDVSAPTPPVKWVLWNIPPNRTELPANVSSSSAMPPEVAGASQLGSLGNQGYAGPCCAGNEYEWVVYALDVASLPDAERRSTAQIYSSVLPEHTIERSEPVMMRIRN